MATLIALLLQVVFGLAIGYEHDGGGSSAAPRIVEQPADTLVARHQPVTLQCRAEGAPPPSVRWFKDGAPLPAAGGRRVVLPAGGLFFLRATHARRDSDAGVYWCEATNRHGTARSRNATLQVAVLRDDFRLEPADTRAAAGDTALLECAPPRGTPEPTVSWKKNGQILDVDDSSRISIVDGGNLVIQDLRQSDDGRYQCIASNIVASRESGVAHLRVHVKPYLIAGPEDAVTLTGSSVTFQCRVGGDPLPDVLWRRSAGGGNMPLGRVHILEDRSLRLDNIVLEDEGEYSCEADNTVGAITASGILKVHSRPHLDVRPMAQSVETGMEAHFECSASGNPKPTIFWSLEGNHSLIFPGVTWDRFRAIHSHDGRTKLILSAARKEDTSTTVVCSAINLAGAVTGRAKLMVTSEDDRPPPIIVLGPSNQTLPVKSIAEFPCSAMGSPEPEVSWYHKSIPLTPNEKVNISESGTLIIKNLEREDSGVYSCVASSRNGKYVSSATLRVDLPTNPSINFFRAPDPSTLPNSPGRPTLINVTDTSVTISWTPNSKVGSSPLLGYQVEMFGNGLDAWEVVGSRLQHTVFTKRYLEPGSQRVFLVRAENSHGLSPPSPQSDTVIIGGDRDDVLYNSDDGAGTALIAEARASLQGDEVVQILEVMPVESTIVKLAWETINSFNVEGFYIYYRPLDGINLTAGEYNMQTVLHSGSASGFSISGLRKYTTYEFFLIPFYKNIDGRPSNAKIARTLEDVPNDGPINLEAFLLNSTFIYLKWKPPPIVHRNGVIQYYRVIIKSATNDSRVIHNVTVSDTGDSPGVNLGGMQTHSSYWLQISAATSAGEGPLTSPVALKLPLNVDPSSTLLEHSNSRNSLGQNPQQIDPGDLLSETWFLALLGSMLAVMTLLFLITFLIRRHHLISKKSALPNLYGTSLVTQLNLKSSGIQHPLASSYNHNSIGKTDSLLWMDTNRPGSWRQTSAKSSSQHHHHHHHHGGGMSEYSQVNEPQPPPLPEYDKIGNAQQNNMPDYAEVDASMITYSKSGCEPDASPTTAYASVTLVGGSGKGNQPGSKGWIQMCAGSKSKINEDLDEEVYPASNGGYYNRNVYTDGYFASSVADRSNMFQFSDIAVPPPPHEPSSRSHAPKYPQETTVGSNVRSGGGKERTYSLPQTPCTTIRRSHRLQMMRSQQNVTLDKEMRTQENPTFGLIENMLDDPGNDQHLGGDVKHFYGHVQPMKLIQHQYTRPTVATSTRPNGKVLTSFSTMKSSMGATGKLQEYHSSTRSEPGNQ